jgi:hypothetical protein
MAVHQQSDPIESILKYGQNTVWEISPMSSLFPTPMIRPPTIAAVRTATVGERLALFGLAREQLLRQYQLVRGSCYA